MPRDVPSVRILPMSDKAVGFRGKTIEQVQRDCFLRDLPKMNGRYQYPSAGLSADPGTVVLFQFQARIIASATFLRDEPFDRPKRGYAGQLYFDPKSFRAFDPIDVESMRKTWPTFRAFGHVKQHLNPTLYRKFARRLKNVRTPST